jgi:hypothetical protein
MYQGKLICVPLNTSMAQDAEMHNLLITPESLVSNLDTAQARRDRHILGTNLQKEAIVIWRGFLQ